MINEKEKEVIINKIISKFPKKHKADLFQECYLKIHQLLKKYNPEILGDTFLKIVPICTFLFLFVRCNSYKYSVLIICFTISKHYYFK